MSSLIIWKSLKQFLTYYTGTYLSPKIQYPRRLFCRILISDKLNQHTFQRKNHMISFIVLNELYLNPCGIVEK